MELLVDYAALRDIGLLDRFLRLPMVESFLDALAHDYHCELDQIDRVRSAFVSDPERRRNMRGTSVVEGRGLSRPTEVSDRYDWERHAGLDFLVSKPHTGAPRAGIWPEENVAVFGDPEMLQSMAQGSGSGVPASDLLPLLVGDGVLMQAAICGRDGLSEPFSDMFFLLTLMGQKSARHFEAGRLRLAADDEGQLVASATLRFAQGNEEHRALAELWRERVREWRDDRRLAAVRPLLEELRVHEDARDVTIEVALGTARTAMNRLERAGMALFAEMQRRRSERGK